MDQCIFRFSVSVLKTLKKDFFSFVFFFFFLHPVLKKNLLFNKRLFFNLCSGREREGRESVCARERETDRLTDRQTDRQRKDENSSFFFFFFSFALFCFVHSNCAQKCFCGLVPNLVNSFSAMCVFTGFFFFFFIGAILKRSK